ncbi:IniB N-terminal domain-containing protein, partial [Micromonospora zhanjiangensis]
MSSAQTLHDFVLNLLTDPDARSAFDLDPEGALHDAGLADVTAADVQDVVPLVVDSVPVPEAAALGALGQPVDLGGLTDIDPVGQLQLITSHLPVTAPSANLDVSAGIAGALAVDAGSYAAGATIMPGLAFGVGPA